MDRARGFTLLDLVIALVVIGILSAIAIPSLASARSATHAVAAREAMVESLQRMIGRTAIAGSEGVLCPADAGRQRCSGSADWSGGWVGFLDRNGDRVLSAGEEIVVEGRPLDREVRLRSTDGRTRLVFQATGGNAGSNVTLTLCDRRGVSKATTLVLANDGRLRQSTPTAAAAQACVALLQA